MKKLRRKQIVAAAIMIFCAACAGVGTVYADEITGKVNPTDGLIAAIAQKFNLNESDVQAVFNERRTQMQARREQNREQMEAECQTEFADRLAKAVAGGKLTQSQADLITAKRVELKAAKTSLEGKTVGERRAAMETQTASLKQWAANNGISEEYVLMCGQGMFGGRGVTGTVTANDGTKITITAKKPNSTVETVYTVTAASGAAISKIDKPASAGAKPAKIAIAFSNIAPGDTISVRGAISGTTISATEIRNGFGGEGFGRGGHGFGGPTPK